MDAVDHSVNYSLDANLFKPNTRLSRVKHLGLSSFWFAVVLLSVVVTNFFQSYPFFSHIFANLCLLIGLFHVFKIGIQRLHDFNWRGAWILGYGIPIAGFFWFLIICCIPGTKGENRFGKQPQVIIYDYLLILTTPLILAFIYLM